ncbi:hypothetical protein [Haloarchaeobius sp. HRN-SO-5]|uniref:hypothetical protein n=1 Tax=Haloarchaeobius sp. HRN-SO-5 TaxID=3446118 RepID=UPI003EBC81B3
MRLRHLLVVTVAVLVLGGIVTAVGAFAVPNECETDYAVTLNRTADTDRPVVEAGNLSRPVQEPVQTAVEGNRTVFVTGEEYEGELANRTIQYEGTLYEVSGEPVQDCGGGTDDLVVLAGFWLAVVGAVATLLVVLYEYGQDLFPTDEEYRRRQ